MKHTQKQRGDHQIEAEADPNRALKRVVIAMGVLLVGGMILLFVLLALGVHKKDGRRAGGSAVSDCVQQVFVLPEGETLLGTKMEDNRVLVHSKTAAGGEQWRLFSVCTGSLLSAFHVAPAMPDDSLSGR